MTLTIDPGVTIQFRDNGNHLVVNGVLIAEGTEGQRITFTSDDAAKERGLWENLRFETVESSGSSLSHCIIEAGGNTGWFGFVPGLIYCANGASPQVYGCTLRMASSDGIRCVTGGSPVVHNCGITDVNGWGLFNGDATTLVDARRNWWGDVSGPLDDSDAPDLANLYNPEGLGCKVSDNVDYSDWLVAPPILRVTIAREGNTVWLSWYPLGDGQYTVQWTNDLVNGTWQNAFGTWPITDTIWAGEDIIGINERFYRVMSW